MEQKSADKEKQSEQHPHTEFFIFKDKQLTYNTEQQKVCNNKTAEKVDNFVYFSAAVKIFKQRVFHNLSLAFHRSAVYGLTGRLAPCGNQLVPEKNEGILRIISKIFKSVLYCRTACFF